MDDDSVMTDVSEKKEGIDESLYSRQLYVWGHEAQKGIGESNVLIVGLRGLGVEIAKNVILAGVKSVSLLDHGLVEISDLSAQFYLTEEDIGKERAAACVSQLADLNKYVKVDVVKETLSQSLLSKGQYKVVVLTDTPLKTQLDINDFTHKNNIKFISGDIHGLMASVFVDFGESHIVTDTTGEQPKRGLISNITRANPGIVTCHEDRRHGLQDGDWVTFEEVEGMTVVNHSKPRPIKVVSPYSFSIEDTSKYPDFTGTKGYFQEVFQPKTFNFKSLNTLLKAPKFTEGADNPGQLHALWLSLHSFQEKKGTLPAPHKLEDAAEVVKLAVETAKTLEGKIKVDEKVLTGLARCSSASISPMAAFAGGVIGQEVLKACSGKFIPVQQFLYYDAAVALPSLDKIDLKEFAPQKSRYDPQIAIFGKTLHKKLTTGRYFLVGAGAIGCEMLKNWALMGVATEGKGQIHVTDMDRIERSNLNRQFLFRESDVSQLKSKTAAREVQKMNKNIKIVAQELRVGSQTEDVYDDVFWEGLDAVITALDNREARLYVDSRCVYFQKPMIDSGTLGTKANTQVIVPFVTESYGSSQDQPEESIPICTLKNFPNKIEHTIQWARDAFEGYFKQGPDEVNNYLSNPSYLEENKKQPNSELSNVQTIYSYLVEEKPLTFDACVAWARQKFEEEFHNNILQLLTVFPPDSKTEGDTPFWSGPKRAPTPVAFDAKDPLHLDFVIAAANLRAFNYGLKGEVDPAYFHKILKTIKLAKFVPKTTVKIATTDAEAKEMSQQTQVEDDHDLKVKTIVSKLPSPQSLAGYRLVPANFEKDDDKNFHMAFITACSNLRARNYKIKEENQHQTKFIAGKIIPAIATTTALVTGLVCLEMFKLLQNKGLDDYRNTYVNLALPLFQASSPIAPITRTTELKDRGKWNWSLWDRIEINQGNITLKEFIDLFDEKFGLEVSMLSYGSSMIYYNFGALKKEVKDRLSLKIPDVVEKVAKTKISEKEKYLVLEAVVANAEGEDVEIPYIRLKFKK